MPAADLLVPPFTLVNLSLEEVSLPSEDPGLPRDVGFAVNVAWHLLTLPSILAQRSQRGCWLSAGPAPPECDSYGPFGLAASPETTGAVLCH